jgi:hypothetical protein
MLTHEIVDGGQHTRCARTKPASPVAIPKRAGRELFAQTPRGTHLPWSPFGSDPEMGLTVPVATSKTPRASGTRVVSEQMPGSAFAQVGILDSIRKMRWRSAADDALPSDVIDVISRSEFGA